MIEIASPEPRAPFARASPEVARDPSEQRVPERPDRLVFPCARRGCAALAGCSAARTADANVPRMDSSNTPELGPETAIEPAKETRDGSIAFTIIMMLIAVACVGITAAIAFHDMAAGG